LWIWAYSSRGLGDLEGLSMSGIICLSVLVALYLAAGWPAVLVGAAVELLVMVLIARWLVDREDAALIRRAQGRG